MGIVDFFETIYYVKIKGFHKHEFERIEDGQVGVGNSVIKWSQFQCKHPDCKITLGLEPWQMEQLPTDMKFKKLEKKIEMV